MRTQVRSGQVIWNRQHTKPCLVSLLRLESEKRQVRRCPAFHHELTLPRTERDLQAKAESAVADQGWCMMTPHRRPQGLPDFQGGPSWLERLSQ